MIAAVTCAKSRGETACSVCKYTHICNTKCYKHIGENITRAGRGKTTTRQGPLASLEIIVLNLAESSPASKPARMQNIPVKFPERPRATSANSHGPQSAAPILARVAASGFAIMRRAVPKIAFTGHGIAPSLLNTSLPRTDGWRLRRCRRRPPFWIAWVARLFPVALPRRGSS